MGPTTVDTVSTAGASAPTAFQVTNPTMGSAPAPASYAGSIASPSTLTSTAVMIQTQVNSLLASFPSEMNGEQMLRMIIALLILQALLGKQDGQPMSQMAQLGGLAGGLDAFGRRSEFVLFSSTNIVQIQHQSTLVYTPQAVQTITEGEPGGQDAPGSRLDVSG